MIINFHYNAISFLLEHNGLIACKNFMIFYDAIE